MAGENSGPGWRGKAAGKSTPANPNWRKAPAASGGGGSRTAKLLGLGACAVAVLIGIVVAVKLLATPQRAGLIAIAGDPGSAARLDVPYDPSGWLSATRLLEAVKGNKDDKAIGSVPGADVPLALDEDKWLDALKLYPKFDPVVIYVGLASGVDRQGEPVLYPGRADGKPVRVADVVKRLTDVAGGTRKVLVLDVGRQMPDPNLGEVRADFARAVLEDKGLADALANSPTVAVVLATGDESRAWDSPERGLTMLAYALREGLLGGAGRKDYESFGVVDLFKTFAADVKRASENERPTAQLPVLLPPEAQFTDGGERARLFGQRPFYTPPERPFDTPTVAPEPPDALKEFWDEQQKLARPKGRPAPWVDTPAAWRRYRELGLRYEQAAVAGDAEGQGVLAEALKVEKARIEAGNGVELKASGLHALPLLGALGRPSPAAARWAASLLGATSLPAFVKKLQDAEDFKVRPPTEAHLPLMLNHYAGEFVPQSVAPSLDATWKPAAACRRLAEQAVLSSPDGLAGFPYSEQVWPAVRAAVLAADEARRRGEDRMLADAQGDKSKTAVQEFEEARVGYLAAIDRAGRIQRALATRDESFADLPFLSRWANEVETLSAATDPGELTGDVEAAWRAAHALAEAIDKALPAGESKAVAPLDAATQKASELTQRVRTRAADESRAPSVNPTQTNLLALQHLATLPVPLVTPAQRATNYRAARLFAEGFRQTKAQVAAGVTPPAAAKATPPVTEAVKATRRVRTAFASLGSPHADAATDRPTATLKDASEIAWVAREHRAREAKFADPAKPDEALSRLAAPYRATEEYEPAAASARRRWSVLLDGLARRAALDHWFGEDNQPYLTKFAQDYLDDAERLRDPAKPVPKSPDATEALKLIAAAKAPDWRYESAAGDRMSDWTTEADNRFTYRFELGGYDKLLPAEAVVWAALSGTDLLTIDAPSTRPRPVSWQAEPDKRSAAVEAACGVPLERRSGETKLTATAYFRGRKVPQVQPIAFNGRPHVVQTDLQPPTGAAVALRADVDPGAVAVVVDYSGSMAEKWDQGNGKTKKEIVVALMRELLPKLPPGTRLSIRLMREDAATKAESRLIYNSAGPLGVNGLTKGDLDAVMATLTDTAPDGLTPLVRTMRLAAQEDFPKTFAGVKTLIVVTDGADTSHISDVPQPPAGGKTVTVNDVFRHPGNPAKLTRLVNDDVEREFRGIAASIQMVVFGADQVELDLAQAMFRPLEDFDDRNRGRVIVAKDEVSLRQELLEALRPRVKLLFGNQAVKWGKPPNEVPRIGVPADLDSDAVTWRGRLDAQSYALKYLNSKAELQLGRGDAVVVRLRKAEGDLKYEFERECYYRDVRGKRPKVAGDRAAESGAFFAHVPNFGVGNPGSELSYLAAVASVDRVGNSLRPGRDGGTLALAHPHALWWEVRRTPVGAKDEARYDKPLSVWNAFGLAAPSWRLVTDGVRDSAELSKGAPFRLAVWPLEQQPGSLGRVSFSNSDLTEGASKSLGGARVRAKLEDLALLGSKYPSVEGQRPFPSALTAKPLRCLVLRVDGDKGGRLLRAKVAWENDTSVAARQHLYYFRDPTQTAEKAEVKAYTVIVGPVTDDFVAGKQGAEVELLDLGEALRQTPSRRMDIELGPPTGDDRAALDAVPFKLDP